VIQLSEEKQADPLQGLREDADSMLGSLSPRQDEVLELKARRPAPSNKEIARLLSGNAISHKMVERDLTRAKEKLGAESVDDAVIEYVMARALVGDPTRGPGDFEMGEAVMKKLARAMPPDVDDGFWTSDDIKHFIRDLRANGPSGWDAKFGRAWRLVPILFVALTAFALVASAVVLADALAERQAEQTSQG